MEVVDLVRITLGRIGTASGMSNEVGLIRERTVEVQSLEVAALRQLVICVAQEQGETGLLDDLRHIQGSGLGITFDIQAGNTTYSTPYAVCEPFPALKAKGRYFRLNEVL